MKKLLLITILLCTCYVSHAQDTVSEDISWYMFMPHRDLTHFGVPGSVGLDIVGHQMYIYDGNDTGDIIVYGVALTINYLPMEEDRGNRVPMMTPSVMLLNHEAYGNPPTVSFIDSTNVLGTMKQCFFKYQLVNGNALISPSYEYYFDTPHLFTMPTDTFYVSFYWPHERYSNYYNWIVNEMHLNSEYMMQRKFARYYIPEGDNPNQEAWTATCSDGNGMFDFDSTESLGGRYYGWGFIFPIVNLRCTAPHLGLAEQNGDTARVTWWQAEAGEAYQLALATYGGNPDTGLLVTPTDTFYTFTGLQPDTIYQVWARKACRYTTAGYDTLVWSDWGRPLTFRASVGIGEVDDMALQVTVRDGGIAVQGLAAGERAEVYDMQGRRVASLTTDGVTPPLPQGVYLLRTTAHSRARKVVLLR